MKIGDIIKERDCSYIVVTDRKGELYLKKFSDFNKPMVLKEK